MMRGSHVRLEKLRSLNAGILNDTYWLRGHLLADVEIGKPLSVIRYERSAREGESTPQQIKGLFESSVVVSTEDIPESDPVYYLITTTNSLWKLIILS